MIFRTLMLYTIARAIFDCIRGRKLVHIGIVSYDPERRTISSGRIRAAYRDEHDG